MFFVIKKIGLFRCADGLIIRQIVLLFFQLGCYQL